MSRKNRLITEKGFTLIEIIGVIVIIGILVTISGIGVSKYIANSKATTYESYKKDLKGAAENYYIDCEINNEEGCDVPIPEYGNSETIGYNLLEEKGYTEKLKDPEGDGYCDKSYVIVNNTNPYGVDLEYQVCLYCDNYKSEEKGCQEVTSDDGVPPTCGETKGESTEWSKENKVITVKCTDSDIGCKKSEFSKSIGKDGEVITTSNIVIEDKAGNKTSCPVKAYVDRKAPTCKIEVDKEPSYNGFYNESSVTARIANVDDEGSGVAAYGMGTSLVNRDYSGRTSYKVTGGIVTVFGYVKDKVGNEGYCSKEIKVDNTRPSGVVYMGYEVYPKENTIKSGNTFIISNISKYGQIEGVIVYFQESLNSNISTSVKNEAGVSIKMTGGLTEGKDYGIIKVIPGEYSELQINIDNKTYSGKVSKIEVIKKENETSVWTNQDVTVYVEAKDTITGLSTYSFNDGSSYISSPKKTYSSNTSNVITIKDNVGNISKEYSFTINKIDKTPPTCTVRGGSSTWINETSSTQSRKVTATCEDTGGSGCVVESFSKTYSSNINTTTAGAKGNNDGGSVSDNAGNTVTCPANRTVKIDKNSPDAPTVALVNKDWNSRENDTWYNHNIYVSGSTNSSNPNPSSSDEGDSGIAKYQISKDNNSWRDWSYDSASDYYKISTEGTTYRYIRAVDGAGNISNITTKTIKVDKTDPSAPTVALVNSDWNSRENNTWYNHNIYVSGSANSSNPNPNSTDTGGSGIAKYQISKDNNSWIDWSYNSTSDYYRISTEGTTYRYIRTVDGAGNISNITTKTIKVDKTDPSCTLTASGTKTNNWYTTNVGIGFNAHTDQDGLSGVASYGIGGYTSSKTATLTIDTSSKTYTGYIKDNAGNTNTCNITVKRDTTKPTCGTFNINGTQGWDGWYVSDVTLSANEGSDNMSSTTTTLNKTEIKGSTYGTNVTLTTKDAAGNKCSKTTTIYIDKTAPTISSVVASTMWQKDTAGNLVSGAYVKGATTCSGNNCSGATLCIVQKSGSFDLNNNELSFTDTYSGFYSAPKERKMYSKNGTLTKSGGCLKTDSDNPCTWTWTYTAYDNAGNTSIFNVSYKVGYIGLGDGSGC